MRFPLAHKVSRTMKKQFILNILGLCFLLSNHSIWADDKVHAVVDIYKTNQVSIDFIRKKYDEPLQQIAEIIQSPDSLTSDKNFKKMYSLMFTVAGGISRLGDFSYVSLSPIFYAGDKTIYFTVDVVDKKDKKRQHSFLKNPSKHYPDLIISFKAGWNMKKQAQNILHD